MKPWEKKIVSTDRSGVEVALWTLRKRSKAEVSFELCLNG